MLRYTIRPISDRTRFKGGPYTPTRFSVKWPGVLDLLEREYEQLDGSDLVIEVDVEEREIRNDGMLRSGARPASPAVVVAFESAARGPLLFACDTFENRYHSGMDSWRHNVHAIAKTLEALRSVDRYGATKSGEQYAGYRQIASAATSLSAAQARDVLAAAAGAAGLLKHTDHDDAELVRLARRGAHPDAGGSLEQWHAVQHAATVLGIR